MPAVKGSRVLVAGGGHRVGKAVSLGLAAAGADVAVSYHTSAAAAEETSAEIAALGPRSAALRADVSDPAQAAAMVRAAAAELGGLDVYVHAPSGGFEPRDPVDVDEALWDAAMDSTAKGFMFAAAEAYRTMRGDGGVVVAITDVAGLQAWPRFAPHAAAKAALIHLVKCLAAAWGPDGVRVCGVAPGPVLMPVGVAGDPDETALRRLGAPSDVVSAVRFCIESDFLTGQNVIVDGGRLLRP